MVCGAGMDTNDWEGGGGDKWERGLLVEWMGEVEGLWEGRGLYV